MPDGNYLLLRCEGPPIADPFRGREEEFEPGTSGYTSPAP